MVKIVAGIDVLTTNSQCNTIFKFWQIAKKSNDLHIFPHDQHTYNKVWLKLNENYGSSRLNIGLFPKYSEWPQIGLERIRYQEDPTYICSICTSECKSQIFVHLIVRSAIFEIFYILGFALDAHVKISKFHKFCKNLAHCQEE